MQIIQSRRSFLTGLSATGVASTLPHATAAQSSSIETTTVRFGDFPGSICTAPQYVAEELLRLEGFSQVLQVPTGDYTTSAPLIEADEIDFGLDYATSVALAVDKGSQMKALAGVHVGCYVLFAHEGINSILDLRGRRVGVGPTLGSDPHLFISTMATYVGLDPRADIEWVQSDIAPVKLFEESKIDAILAFPPEVQEIRRRKIGHVIVNSMADRPWSHYFCCMLVANTAFAQNYPVATKSVVRAMLKAADICISDPQRALRILMDKGYVLAEQSDDARSAINEIPYGAWRDYDPEDTIRFFALGLHEAGLITTNPQKIIADGTDWSFVNEVKRELKA